MKLLRLIVLAACFAPASQVPAQPAKGTYNGLFISTNGIRLDNSGYFTLTTSGAGAFTGKLQIGNARASFANTFINGIADVDVRILRTQTVHLHIEAAALSDTITGTLSSATWSADLLSYRGAFDGKSLLAPQAGRYTILIPATSNSPGLPSADGYATVTVTTAGKIMLSGSLADGTKITQSTSLSTNNQWPLFVSLYTGQGLVLSWVTFAPTVQSALSGDLNWIKPLSSTAKYYPAGFTNQTEILGFAYSPPPKGSSVLPFTDGALTFQGGDLAQTITNHVFLDSKSRVSNLGHNKLSMSITPATGAFRGSVIDPASAKSLPFGGVIVQTQNRGAGSFLGATQAGQVDFSSSYGDLVQFQTIGSSFAPEVAFNSATSAFGWLWSDSSTSSSTNPNKQFPDRAAREQLLSAYPYSTLTSVNIGFDAADGGETTPLSTNRPQQNVNAVYFPYPLTSLRYWASSYNPITNTLDFRGFTSLEAIECFHCTNLEAVVITNLPSLKRICLEACYLPELNLSGNPKLEDIRAALNTFTEIKLGAGTGPNVWHFCTRENRNITQRYQDLMINFHSLREPWIWHNNQSGHISFVSTNLTDVEIWGNEYTSADFTGQKNMFILWAYENNLTNLVLTGCTGLQDLQANNNNLPSQVLNQIVIDLQSCERLQFVDLRQNAGFLTSPAALNAYTNLINGGRHIYVDWPP